MMPRRSRGREVALQVLYQVEQNPGFSAEEIRRFCERRLLDDQAMVAFTRELVAGVRERRGEIDEAIQKVAENWRLDRMAAIDRNILRLGAFEILFDADVPAKVAINEALELAKRYSTAQSSRFVNGILDKVAHSRDQPAEDEAGAATEPDADAGAEDEHKVEPDADEPRPGGSAEATDE